MWCFGEGPGSQRGADKEKQTKTSENQMGLGVGLAKQRSLAERVKLGFGNWREGRSGGQLGGGEPVHGRIQSRMESGWPEGSQP